MVHLHVLPLHNNFIRFVGISGSLTQYLHRKSGDTVAISLTPFEHGDLCRGNTWAVEDENLLASQIARVALGQSRHVQKILAGANLTPVSSTARTAEGAISLLTVTGADPWHRDGWMFQAMSWIAANQANPNAITRAPHMIHAHKGFDGIQIEVNKSTGSVDAVVIFEDKATDKPRDTIREDVWPEFSGFEGGSRENVLTAEVTALLQTQPDVDPDSAIDKLIWGNTRRFRVSITVGDTHANDAGRERLFKGYESTVPGPVHKRGGETFYVKNLRGWMANIAEMTIAIIQEGQEA